jgi:hypothetical protein
MDCGVGQELKVDADDARLLSPAAMDSSAVQSKAESLSQKSSSLFLLASTKFVSNLDEASFQVLYNEIEWVHLKPGQTLFEQGTRVLLFFLFSFFFFLLPVSGMDLGKAFLFWEKPSCSQIHARTC